MPENDQNFQGDIGVNKEAMPEANADVSALKNKIEDLEKKLAESKKETITSKKNDILSKERQPFTYQGAYQKQYSSADKIDDPVVKHELEKFIGTAFEKGVFVAAEEAKKTGNAYLMDKFHDIIVDELYKKLVESGRLKNV